MKKKISIITLTRQNSLAYAALKRIVVNLGYEPLCGEAIGTDCIFFPLEEIHLVGYDFLAGFFQKAGFSEADVHLISVPYTVNLFTLPKVIHCLRSINPAPIIVGGNEVSNNYKNMMHYRSAAFVNQVVDISPDFIVRGSAETVLYRLLPLLDRTTLAQKWNRNFLSSLLDIPNIVFWLPARDALMASEFTSDNLSERDTLAYVKYGDESMAVTFQRACFWAKQSQGGCLFCAIAGQFGKDFHCRVTSDFFIEEMLAFLQENPQIKYVDIWDDTFNIDETWAVNICGYLRRLNQKTARTPRYSCFLRPKGLSPELVEQMRAANIRTAFMGADAVTEALSKRLRRGCTVSEMNRSIELLAKGSILPSLSVQLFSPESTLDDVGITSTLALGCIKNGKSTVHVHLYTFPLYGSDIYKLLDARKNLKKIPSPMMQPNKTSGYEPYFIAYDYKSYDPDVEDIKQRTYTLLNIETSFHVRTYPGGTVDGHRLKEVLKQVRRWCQHAKKSHHIKALWYMMILFLEDQDGGLSQANIIDLLSSNETPEKIPPHLKKIYADFGYRYTLSRSFGEVVAILLEGNCIQKDNQQYRLTPGGVDELKAVMKEIKSNHLDVAAYGSINRMELLKRLMVVS
jgi:radical SAM superfamily enzyme YgiQ (UPF0313 family)